MIPQQVPQYARPRSQSTLGRVTWVDPSPDEPAWVSFADAEVPATKPVSLTCVVGDLVSLTWTRDTLLITSVIAHAPQPTDDSASEDTPTEEDPS